MGSMRRDRLDRTDFYVYTYAYPFSMGGTVFYIGKGCNSKTACLDRIDAHEREAQKGHMCERCQIIRFIWEQDEQVVKNKYREQLSEAVAYQIEAQLIDEYGLVSLVNKQGGHKIDRWRGASVSEESKEELFIEVEFVASEAELKQRSNESFNTELHCCIQPHTMERLASMCQEHNTTIDVVVNKALKILLYDQGF